MAVDLNRPDCCARVGELGYSTKFHTGRLRPEVQPPTLLCTILTENVPLSYAFY